MNKPLLEIEKSSNDFSQLLSEGNYQQDRGWVASAVQGNVVTFIKPNVPSPSKVYVWFKATRAISLTATLMPALATLLLCVVLGYSIDNVVIIPALIAMLLLQISVNLFNDVADYTRLIDLPNTLGGAGMIQSGWLTAKQVSKGAWSSLLLACVLAIPAIVKAPQYVLICAFLAGLGVLGYSGKPFHFKYRAMGDVLVFLLCGPVLTAGVSLVASNLLTQEIMALGLFFGLLSCTILNANNINDINIDSARGAKTLAGILGFQGARWLQVGYYASAIMMLICLVLLVDYWLLLPLLGLGLVIIQIRKLFAARKCDEASLDEVRFDAAKIHLMMSLLLCVGLGLAIAFA